MTATPEQQQQYQEQCYVVFERLFKPEELRPLIAELDAAVDRLARKYCDDGEL